MKLNVMTAAGTRAHARTRDACPSGKATVLAKTRRAGLRLLGVFASLVILVPLTIGHAFGSCETQYRMSHGDSDCLHGWWDNTPPVSTGVAAGSTFGVQSFCHKYGDVVAKIDLIGGADETWTLSNGSKVRGKSAFNNVRDISCCIDRAELCVKAQAETNNFKIKYYAEGNSTLQTADVRTRFQRYTLCQDHPDIIYCELDPRGDAHWEPNCGDRDCIDQDCKDGWNDSDASDTCTLVLPDIYVSNYIHTQPVCKTSTRCTKGLASETVYLQEFKLSDMADLDMCDDLSISTSC